MIYLNKKFKSQFDEANAIVAEEDKSIKLGKIILMSNMTHEEVNALEKEEWDVIYKNGEYRDLRTENLELVIFKDDDFFENGEDCKYCEHFL